MRRRADDEPQTGREQTGKEQTGDHQSGEDQSGENRSGEETARQLRRGSPDAVRLVRRRVRRILAFRGYGIGAEERRDLEQEVMTQLWQAVNRSGFSGARFWGFVEVVTARRSIDWLRTRKPLTVLDEKLPASGRGPLATVLARERTARAHAVLAELGRPCRELLYLHFALRKPYRELSGLLGKSEGALRVQLHRCVAQARRILLAQSDDDQSAADQGAAGEPGPLGAEGR